jgi:methylmalonyl-CoA mutase N-terminal domain/subunit
MKVDPALEEAQVRRLRAFRAARDGAAATRAVDAVRRGARGTDNLVPLVLDAVKARADPGRDLRRAPRRLRRVPGDGGSLSGR